MSLQCSPADLLSLPLGLLDETERQTAAMMNRAMRRRK